MLEQISSNMELVLRIKMTFLLDVLLTKKPNCFQKTIICETGLTNCHKLVIATFRSPFIKLSPKTVTIGPIKTLMRKSLYMNYIKS